MVNWEAITDGVRPLTPEAIRALESEVAQLTHLINDLHDLALADGGNLRYQFHRVDLASLLEDTLESYQGTFEQHGNPDPQRYQRPGTTGSGPDTYPPVTGQPAAEQPQVHRGKRLP